MHFQKCLFLDQFDYVASWMSDLQRSSRWFTPHCEARELTTQTHISKPNQNLVSRKKSLPLLSNLQTSFHTGLQPIQPILLRLTQIESIQLYYPPHLVFCVPHLNTCKCFIKLLCHLAHFSIVVLHPTYKTLTWWVAKQIPTHGKYQHMLWDALHYLQSRKWYHTVPFQMHPSIYLLDS